MKSGYIKWKHLVSSRPWPLCMSLGVYGLLSTRVYRWYRGSFFLLFFKVSVIVFLRFIWWGDIRIEGSEGRHNSFVIIGFRVGMALFILSEVFFFFSFFWGYFHKVFSPGLELGLSWPPIYFRGLVVDPFSIPLLKTIILLSSGARITWSHHGLIRSDYDSFIWGLLITVILGLTFLVLQLGEYSESYFRFKRTVYGSSFYILTGFHGLHVLIGSLFIVVCLIRGLFLLYSRGSHVRFILCSWYWHFVDVVWLFLYFFLYWFGY